jgi:hypothetical protein
VFDSPFSVNGVIIIRLKIDRLKIEPMRDAESWNPRVTLEQILLRVFIFISSFVEKEVYSS